MRTLIVESEEQPWKLENLKKQVKQNAEKKDAIEDAVIEMLATNKPIVSAKKVSELV